MYIEVNCVEDLKQELLHQLLTIGSVSSKVLHGPLIGDRPTVLHVHITEDPVDQTLSAAKRNLLKHFFKSFYSVQLGWRFVSLKVT